MSAQSLSSRRTGAYFSSCPGFHPNSMSIFHWPRSFLCGQNPTHHWPPAGLLIASIQVRAYDSLNQPHPGFGSFSIQNFFPQVWGQECLQARKASLTRIIRDTANAKYARLRKIRDRNIDIMKRIAQLKWRGV